MARRLLLRKADAGFTLIELVSVIVILGVLAATALPRFINMGSSARYAAVQGMAGSLNAQVQLVSNGWQAHGGSGGTFTMGDGTVVTVDPVTGMPTAAATGIGAAMNCTASSCGGYTVTFGPLSTTFRPSGGSGTCQVRYTSAGVVSVPPDESGC